MPLYERIRTPGGLQVVRLVPREDVERILAPNNGRKALLLERWLMKNIFPALEADEVALAQVRSLVVGFVSAMHTLMTEQYFADKYGGCNGRCK